MNDLIFHKKISSFQLIIFSFLFLILVGSFLLMLPFSSAAGEWTPFTDALFTATSAVCVTGLIVVDTATYWSQFGQVVIISLIQIGGMGVITVLLAASAFRGKKISLVQRQTMQEAISAPQLGGIVRMTKFIIKGTFLFEFVGFLLMSLGFADEFGSSKCIWYGLFHSISAFCNAGFDLMGIKEQFSSMTFYYANPIINLTIIALIIIGGIGFLSWDDIKKHKHHFRFYRFQTKIILLTSFTLIMLPALYFFFCEYAAYPLGERFLLSLFQSVTTRTAGFNTADLMSLHDSGKMLMIVLMLIGGSPGSTAGGLKTTTIAVLIICMISILRQESVPHCFGRRIGDEITRNAVAILFLYLILFLTSGGIISYIEGIPLLTSLFETASAIGTVGLTLGITTKLGMISRLILIFLMYFGRVGGLTFVFAALSAKRNTGNHFPQEKITVG